MNLWGWSAVMVSVMEFLRVCILFMYGLGFKMLVKAGLVR